MLLVVRAVVVLATADEEEEEEEEVLTALGAFAMAMLRMTSNISPISQSKKLRLGQAV